MDHILVLINNLMSYMLKVQIKQLYCTDNLRDHTIIMQDTGGPAWHRHKHRSPIPLEVQYRTSQWRPPMRPCS